MAVSEDHRVPLEPDEVMSRRSLHLGSLAQDMQNVEQAVGDILSDNYQFDQETISLGSI